MALLDATPPPFKENDPTDEKIRTLYKYLIRLYDKLTFVLKNIDDENLNNVFAQNFNSKVSSGDMETQIKQLASAFVVTATATALQDQLNGTNETVTAQGDTLSTITRYLQFSALMGLIVGNTQTMTTYAQILENVIRLVGNGETLMELSGSSVSCGELNAERGVAVGGSGGLAIRKNSDGSFTIGA